ncbi:MAG: hypothetical protein O9972_09620 [Burkholderiales bacterium]|nr:hypothetical protein [Burkholderiales bacterium]
MKVNPGIDPDFSADPAGLSLRIIADTGGTYSMKWRLKRGAPYSFATKLNIEEVIGNLIRIAGGIGGRVYQDKPAPVLTPDEKHRMELLELANFAAVRAGGRFVPAGSPDPDFRDVAEPIDVVIRMSRSEAETASLGLADLLCWVAGYKAAQQDSEHHPMGVYDARNVRSAIQRALEASKEGKP